MRCAVLLATAVALSACAPNFSEHPSAEEVLSVLDKPWIGRERIEESFIEHGGAEDEILAGICTASPPWLEVAHRMFDTNNAHWGEELSSALSVALTKQPKAVLEKFNACDICGAPDDLPKSCALPDWRNAALQALRTVDDPALAAARQHCEVAVTHAFIPNPNEEEKP